MCYQKSDLSEAQEVGDEGVVGLVEETGLEDEGEQEALVLLVVEKALPAIEVSDLHCILNAASAVRSASPHQLLVLVVLRA